MIINIMSCGDIVVRIQQGGTCWFNASLNGWLLSDVGRKLLVRYLNKYKNSNNYKKYANINACPMRGRVPLAYLWSYIDNALKPPTQRQINAYNNAYLIENAKLRELRKVNQITNLNKFLISATNNNNSVKNRIKAAGIQSLNNLKGKNEAYLKSLGFKTIPARLLSRSSVSSYLNLNVKEASRRRNTSGGTSGDDYYLTRTLFKDLFVTLTSINIGNLVPGILLDSDSISYKRVIRNNKYELSHAFLVISLPSKAHAVCGFICKNKEYIFDSATNKTYPCNWTKGADEILENYINKSEWKGTGAVFNSKSSQATYLLKAPQKKVNVPKVNLPKVTSPRVNVPVKGCMQLLRAQLNKLAEARGLNWTKYKTKADLCKAMS